MNAVVSHVEDVYAFVDENVSFVGTWLRQALQKCNETRGKSDTRRSQFLGVEGVTLPCLK